MASLNAEEFAYEFGETAETFVETNKSMSDEDIRRQVVLDFEEELKKMGPVVRPPQSQQQSNDNSQAVAVGNMLVW